jgi:hypothetical protein
MIYLLHKDNIKNYKYHIINTLKFGFTLSFKDANIYCFIYYTNAINLNNI